MKDCIPWEGPHTEAEEQHEAQGAAETMSDELTTVPIPLCRSEGKETEELGTKE